ncbi:MAG: hypothetical protein [Siphoviridae sp. ct7UA22]|nr:MAG: hypothetical protein [Siphoviridae sp. ct7UA22]
MGLEYCCCCSPISCITYNLHDARYIRNQTCLIV